MHPWRYACLVRVYGSGPSNPTAPWASYSPRLSVPRSRKTDRELLRSHSGLAADTMTAKGRIRAALDAVGVVRR